MSSGCCRAAHGADALISAARCLHPAGPANCTHEATSQATTKALWLDCGSLRGLFLISHDKDGNMVCTEGDVYRVWAVESRTRYSTYTIAIGGLVWPSLYFANLTGGMLMGSRRKYRVSASLLETQNRSLELAEHHLGLHFSASTASPTRDWFRYRLCVGHGVSLSSKSHDGSMTVETHNEPQSTGAVKAHEPRCRALPPSSSSVIVALDDSNRSHHPFACGHLCTGNASARVLRPFRGPKDTDRAHLGFRHILKPEGCHYHWFDENELGRCLAGREVLNIGGSVANSLQRGFERISSVAANKMNWWWNYGRTGINNNHDEATGKSRFNGSIVTTQFIHHPFRYGLANVIRPNPKLVVGPKSKAAYETLMCKHDLVIFESGVHDLASIDRRVHRKMLDLCAPPKPPCTDEELMPILHNESWRLDLFAAYRAHLEELMGMWKQCADQRAKQQRTRRLPFRPIFKLSYVPNSATELRSCGAEWGYNTQGQYLLAGNALAREVVERAGFEVFDPTPALLHAQPNWYDLNGKDALHSDTLSDLVTQMLINQLCADDAIESR